VKLAVARGHRGVIVVPAQESPALRKACTGHQKHEARASTQSPHATTIVATRRYRWSVQSGWGAPGCRIDILLLTLSGGCGKAQAAALAFAFPLAFL